MTLDALDVWHRLLTTLPVRVAFSSLVGWREATQALRREPSTLVRAMLLGASADRVATVFEAGYSSALVALLPDVDLGDRLAAFCVTESSGGHPNRLTTRLERDSLFGVKQFASFGELAQVLVVIASEGRDAEGKYDLRAVLVESAQPGVVIQPSPELPFVPEVSHATIAFEGARGRVLPHDAFGRYVKPFRTLEDLHVNAALVGYLLALAHRHGWPPAARETLAGPVFGLLTLDPRNAQLHTPAGHAAVASVLALVSSVVAALEPDLQRVDAAERARFQRDRALFDLGAKPRALRRERAWATILGQR